MNKIKHNLLANERPSLPELLRCLNKVVGKDGGTCLRSGELFSGRCLDVFGVVDPTPEVIGTVKPDITSLKKQKQSQPLSIQSLY